MKEEIDLVIVIPSAIIIVGIFLYGFGLWTEFYDFNTISGSDNTFGEIDIDTDTFEDIEESLDELNETVWEGFDFDALWSAIMPIIIFMSIISMLIMFRYILK